MSLYGRIGTIKIQTTVYENELIPTVTDDGCGIPKEEQNRIFERFYRVSKSRQRHTGGSDWDLRLWHTMWNCWKEVLN